MNIAVASTSVHKLAAVERACAEVFGAGIHVQGYKARSGVSEQPYGQAETLLGAENRLRHLLELVGDTQYDLRVAMEGGLFPVGEDADERYFDCGWVVASDAAGAIARGTCTGVEYPKSAVTAARARGFRTTTVGTILQERGDIVDNTDTHASLSDGVLTRADVLHVGLLSALGQLLRQSETLRRARQS